MVTDDDASAGGDALSATVDISITLVATPLTLLGTVGADVLRGGRASDSLVGGSHSDQLSGGAGNDALLRDGWLVRHGSFEYWAGGTASTTLLAGAYVFLGPSHLPGIAFENLGGPTNAYLRSWVALIIVGGMPPAVDAGREVIARTMSVPPQAGMLVADLGSGRTSRSPMATRSAIAAGTRSSDSRRQPAAVSVPGPRC